MGNGLRKIDRRIPDSRTRLRSKRLETKKVEAKKVEPIKIEPKKVEETKDELVKTNEVQTTSAVTQTIPGPKDSTPKKTEVTPERRAQIEDYDRKIKDAPDTQSSFYKAKEAEKVAQALKGESELGPMNDEESKILLDKTMHRWTGADGMTDVPGSNGKVNYGAIKQLSIQAQKDPKLAEVVSRDYAQRSLALIDARQPGYIESIEKRALAPTLAAESMAATAGNPQLTRKITDELGPQNSANLINELTTPPKDVLATGNTELGKPHDMGMRYAAVNLMLDGAAQPPPNTTSATITDLAFAKLPKAAYEAGSGRSVSNALATHWHPNDAALRESEANRLAGVFETERGRSLLGNEQVPHQQRLVQLAAVKENKEWNKEFFESENSEEIVASKLAEPRMQQFATLRGDNPQTLKGTDLENTIGFSMNQQVNIPENETEAQRDQREKDTAAGNYNYYTTAENKAVLAPVVDSIRKFGGDEPKVTVLPVQTGSIEEGYAEVPLFRVQDKTTGEDRFVDNLGRTYNSFEAWKTENQLPPGKMVYPKDGHLTPDAQTETRNTPSVVDTTGEKIKSGLDTAALVGGTIAGGAIIIGSGGTLAPVVATGAGIWMGYRAAESLNDRYQHGQTLNPLKDGEARAQWIVLGASALGTGAAAFTKTGALLAQNGSRAALPIATTAGFLRVGAAVLDAGAATNSGYELISNWDKLSGAERAQLGLSMAFWGGSTVAGARISNTSVKDSFNFRAVRDATLYGHLNPNLRTTVQETIAKSPKSTEAALGEIVNSKPFQTMTPVEQHAYVKKFGAMNADAQKLQLEAIRSRAEINVIPKGTEVDALTTRSTPFTAGENIPGGSYGVTVRNQNGKYLRTTDIESTDLPYQTSITPAIDNPTIPKRLEDFQIAPLKRTTDVVFASNEHSGSGGVVNLAELSDGRPVAIKAIYGKGTKQENMQKILDEARSAKLTSDMGIGPKFHGVHQDAEGRWYVVTDIARGDFSGTKVTKQSFEDLDTIFSRLKGAKIAPHGDFQLYRDNDGRVSVIDPAPLAEMVGKKPLDPPDSPRGVATRERVSLLVEADPSTSLDYLTKLKDTNPEAWNGVMKRMQNAFQKPQSAYDEKIRSNIAFQFYLQENGYLGGMR